MRSAPDEPRDIETHCHLGITAIYHICLEYARQRVQEASRSSSTRPWHDAGRDRLMIGLEAWVYDTAQQVKINPAPQIRRTVTNHPIGP
jgi:hypothetical protein